MYYVTLANGIMLAYLVASFAPSMDAANAILPAIVVTFLFLGGLIMVARTVPVYLSWYS